MEEEALARVDDHERLARPLEGVGAIEAVRLVRARVRLRLRLRFRVRLRLRLRLRGRGRGRG